MMRFRMLGGGITNIFNSACHDFERHTWTHTTKHPQLIYRERPKVNVLNILLHNVI